MQGLDIHWTELKAMKKYSMPIVADLDSYLTCIFHALGCFWAVERGLYRTDEQSRSGLNNYLFPDLHKSGDNKVAEKIRNVVRKCLPKPCPQEVSSLFSGKSMRKGALTELSMAPHCETIFQVAARSGHSLQCSMDFYIDKENPARGLPAALALAGSPDPTNVIYLPRLEVLGEHNKSQCFRLLQEVFCISVAYFKPGGRLFAVTKTCLASLIMHHNQVTVELGMVNAVATYMRQSARKVGLTDPQNPGHEPAAVLSSW